jgi:hypothetical protein
VLDTTASAKSTALVIPGGARNPSVYKEKSTERKAQRDSSRKTGAQNDGAWFLEMIRAGYGLSHKCFGVAKVLEKAVV